jgi:hypothetical protein
MRNIESPEHVRRVVVGLIKGKLKHEKIVRAEIPAEHLAVLDAHARELFSVEDCEVLSVEGCNSCCADGVSGSLSHTTCGDFCDKVCGAEPCH